MGEATVQNHVSQGAAGSAGQGPPRAARRSPVRAILAPIASLKLTVALLALSIFLVFCGTLAQIGEGNWTAVARYFRTVWTWIPLQIFVNLGQRLGFASLETRVPGHFPFPGGWLIGGVLLLNLLAAHATRFHLTWKRSGILLIHAGLIVLLVGEFVTGIYAVEGHMSILEGRSSDYVEQSRDVELAVVDASDPTHDEVTAVPGAQLRRGGRIRHPALPFDVEVVRYMTNATLTRVGAPPAPSSNPATAGNGLGVLAIERPEVSGTDMEQKVDVAAAYVTLRHPSNGRDLGTWLVSLMLSEQGVAVDDRTYDVSLRFRRSYRPFTLHLKRFTHETYAGTDKPRNFSSLVRLVDPEHGVDREVRIWMNHPLRYEGETFYQADWLRDETGTVDTGTVLQVVRNPGWLLPYVSCALVSGGLLAQFLMSLAAFLRRRRT